ncbi:MAG: amino acid ABC transporter substrate-binding protein [Desulfobacteraceae bacterium]|nr:MAG: amino acid ABC transporter substrate-binding protein [Desulfobacteraceae bacterium]
MKKAAIAGVLLAVFVSGTLVVYSLKKSDPEPLKIGYIGSISGKFSSLGTSARNGAMLAVEELNSLGGIDGRQIELIIRDDQGEAENTIPICEEFSEQGINLVIGPFTTASATRLLPCINEKRILTFGPVTAGENLAGQDDMFIKLFPSTSEFGAALAELAADMKIFSMGLINDQKNKPFGDTLISGFKPVFEEKGGRILANVDFNSGSPPKFSSLVKEAVKGTPEGVVVIANAIDTALIIQNIQKYSPGTQVFVSPWSMSADLINSGGQAVEGTMAYIPFDQHSDAPSYTRFKAAYEERFKELPPFVAAFNYEAVYLVRSVIEQSASLDPEILKQALLGAGQFKGLQSDYEFNETGDAIRQLFLYQVNNKTITKIKQ